MVTKLVFSIFFILFMNISFAATAVGHAPIGVSGDHYHKASEKMISLRYSSMKMKGNSLDGNFISDQNIILTQTNPYSSMPNAPLNLSIVPQEMEMEMLMIGGMYATSDYVTYMGMLMFMKNKMLSNTYRGAMNRAYLGNFQTSIDDLSNVSLSMLYRISETKNVRWHIELGLDKSIGKNNNKNIMLSPMNSYMEMTMPYAMQMDESTKFIAGLTNSRDIGNIVFGSQIKKYIVIDDKDWAFGNKLEVSSWIQKPFSDSFSVSGRLLFSNQGRISGESSLIKAPVQLANPLNYGGRTLDLGIGLNAILNLTEKNHDRLGLEIIFTIDENKNGLQMKNDYKFIFGYQKSF